MEQIEEITATGYEVQTITTSEDIEKIRDIWDQLNTHPNSDLDFYLYIQSVRDEIVQPHIILFKENGRPKAMVIGRIEDSTLPFKIGYKTVYNPQVRVLNIIFGGLFGNFDEDMSKKLVKELMQSLKENQADLAIIKHIKTDSVLHKIAKKLPGLFNRGYLSEVSIHRTSELPGTLDGFLDRFSHKQRSTLRRNEKRLRKAYPDKARFRIFKDEADVAQLCEDAETVARLTYQRGIDSGFKYDDEHFQRLSLAARNGRLRAYLLYVDDKPCGFWIGTLYKDVFHSDFIGYDASYQRYSPGMIIFLRMVEDLSDFEVSKFDFGLGDAGYKQRFADSFWEEASVYIYAPTLKAIKINIIRTLTNLINHISRKTLSKGNLILKVKKKWRDLIRPTE